jgi:hypothetical protein
VTNHQSVLQYLGCSATKMANKTNSQGKPREAIYIPHTEGHQGIFINRTKW